MRWKLCALAFTLLLAVGLPVSAAADDQADAVSQAKGMDADGPNAPPDLISETGSPVLSGGAAAIGTARRGVQVNDAALDNTQFFPNALPQPQRPYELSVQSETSVVSFGRTVVAGFNNSADQPVTLTPDNHVAFLHRFLSGVGTSHDGGRTWREFSLPPPAGSPFTFGDPALAVDRHGNFYYASLGATAAGQSLVFVGKSTNGGDSFGPGVVAALDPGADKEWIAVGPDPKDPARDNVYVTWTSFQFSAAGATTGSQVHLARSVDGGQTWTTSTLFAPVATAATAPFIQFSNPVVDERSGRLYVPFIHFGTGSQDFVRVLASDDGGLTFRLLDFNAPGAPDTAALPNVAPGTLADCGVGGGFRNVLHVGPDQGGGRLGLPSFRRATRLTEQPAAAAVDGRLVIAINSSTSSTVGDPASRSVIRLISSPDGGRTWAGPFTLVGATNAEPQHVNPTIQVDDPTGRLVSVGYYAQRADGRLQVNAALALVGGQAAHVLLVDHLGPAFDLIPSNNPLPAAVFGPNQTTNYDRTIRPCYDIGEYMSVTNSQGRPLFVFGDNRNSWTSPPQSPAAGTHSQPDVFAARG